MARRSSVDDRLLALRSVRDEGHSDSIRATAIKALSDTSNLVIAEAARLIGQFELSGTEPELVSTWTRLFEHPDPLKADRGCTAKTAIIESLGKLSYDDPDLYLAAMTYSQLEPAWGKPQDSAESIRGGSAFALARSQKIRIVDKLNAFVTLLRGSRVDRVHAIRAMTDTGSESVIPLLRLKLLSGDAEAEVMGACMSGLLELAQQSSIPLIIEFLKNDDDNIVLEAAAALGVCGKPEAVDALIKAWNRTRDDDVRRSLLLSIGLSRDKTATDFLIAQLESKDDAAAALEALKPACVYQETQTRIRSVLETISDENLRETFEKSFGPGNVSARRS